MAVKLIVGSDTGSNKPEKHAVQFAAQAYWHIRPTNYRVSVLKPKIDRLSITLDIADTTICKTIRQHLIDMADAGNPLLTVWKKRKGWGSGKYDRSLALNVGDNRSIMVQCAPIKSKVSFLRFEFNPTAVGLHGIAAFRSHLPKITSGALKYKMLAHSGKVTRLDIAVDLVNIDLEDVLIRTKKPGVTSGYFGLTGKAETKYLNVNKKGSNLYVYDRKTHLQKLKAQGIGSGSEYGQAKYTRVEVRTEPNVPITELSKLHNRLTKIELTDIEAAKPPEQEHHWKLFQDSCRYRGLAGALALLPDKVRPDYEAAITSAGTGLWKSDLLLSFWPEVVNQSGLLPAAGGSD